MSEDVVARVVATAADLFQRPVSPVDSFFDLGGDSLTAIELALGIEAWLGSEVDVSELVSADSLAAFARTLTPQAP